MIGYIIIGVVFIGIVGGYLGYHIYRLLPLKYRKKRMVAVIVAGLVASGMVYRMMVAILINVMLFLLFFDCIWVIIKLMKKDSMLKAKRYLGEVMAIVLSIGFSVYGIYNAGIITTTHYTITVDKEFTDKKIIAVSDLHLGVSVKEDELDALRETVKTENPDYVFLVGDVYDEGTSVSLAQYSYQVFSDIAKEYPVYYVQGNHEKGYGSVSPLTKLEVEENLQAAGVVILDDEAIEVDDIYLIGRVDYSYEDRKEMNQIIDEDKTEALTILLDHQPKEQVKNSEKNIDLQISGHTHGGQLFPIGQLDTLFTINEMNYGIKTINNMTAIVSSGMGTWGFAMRTNRHCEIVIITIQQA